MLVRILLTAAEAAVIHSVGFNDGGRMGGSWGIAMSDDAGDTSGLRRDGNSGSRPRRWRRLLVALTAVGASVVAAEAVPGAQNGRRVPAEVRDAARRTAGPLLTAVRSTLEEVRSFRFIVRGEAPLVEGEQTLIEGSWSEGRSYTLRRALSGVSETIADGETAYNRNADSVEALDDVVWTVLEGYLSSSDLLSNLAMSGVGPDESDTLDRRAVDAAAWIYLGGPHTSPGFMAMATGGYVGIDASILGGFAGEPTGFVDALVELGEPIVVDESDGVVTLTSVLSAPDDLVDAFGHPIPDGRVQLDVGSDNLPTALRFDIKHGSAESRINVEFAGWNQPVEIPVPSGDEVDMTPWLDEDGLRELTDFSFVVPTALPEGWLLSVDAGTDSGEIEPDADGCVALFLDWSSPIPDEAQDDVAEGTYEHDYLSILLRSEDCAMDEEPTPFRPDGPGGFPSRTYPDLPGQATHPGTP